MTVDSHRHRAVRTGREAGHVLPGPVIERRQAVGLKNDRERLRPVCHGQSTCLRLNVVIIG